jgi:hypothetical protein
MCLMHFGFWMTSFPFECNSAGKLSDTKMRMVKGHAVQYYTCPLAAVVMY